MAPRLRVGLQRPQLPFTFDDFLKAMNQIQKLAPVRSVMRLLPGTEAIESFDPDADLKRVRAMIQSMTFSERQNPVRIDDSRRGRIARGSRTEPDDVRDLIEQFKGFP
jgi:signal recognition particle subunit SRP54